MEAIHTGWRGLFSQDARESRAFRPRHRAFLTLRWLLYEIAYLNYEAY